MYGPRLSRGARFRMTTFGLEVQAEVREYELPGPKVPGRVAWHGWVEGNDDQQLDFHHAWLIENLSGNRVRVLTQEAQLGKFARRLAVQKPNPLLNEHQNWIEGLEASACKRTNR